MKKLTKMVIFALSLALFVLHSTPAEAASAKISNKRISLIPGETFKLSVKNNTKKIKWSSNKKNVAKVNYKGKVTALSPGKAMITAKIGSKKYSCVVTVQKTVDVIVFCGQSNMTGVGDASEAPNLIQGAGYAFNYVTNKNKFSKLEEPFGYGQDDTYFLNGDYCKGSMVTSFVNAYYKQTKTPVIAVPASCVGTGSVSWKEFRYKGIIQRVNAAVRLVKKKKMKVGHVYMVWMQGENDAFANMSAREHKDNLKSIVKSVKKKTHVETCMIIGLPNYYYDFTISENYKRIKQAQKDLCKYNKNFVLLTAIANTLPYTDLQSDGLHIKQSGLNKIGTDAGKRAGKYANSH